MSIECTIKWREHPEYSMDGDMASLPNRYISRLSLASKDNKKCAPDSFKTLTLVNVLMLLANSVQDPTIQKHHSSLPRLLRPFSSGAFPSTLCNSRTTSQRQRKRSSQVIRWNAISWNASVLEARSISDPSSPQNCIQVSQSTSFRGRTLLSVWNSCAFCGL